MKSIEVIRAVCEETSVSRADATAVVNAVLRKVSEAVAKGESVSFKGAGQFRSSKTRADGSSVIIFRPAGATKGTGTAAAEE
jgi:nucleoid DNA-binding protein